MIAIAVPITGIAYAKPIERCSFERSEATSVSGMPGVSLRNTKATKRVATTTTVAAMIGM